MFFADPAVHWYSIDNPRGISSFSASRFSDMVFVLCCYALYRISQFFSVLGSFRAHRLRICPGCSCHCDPSPSLNEVEACIPALSGRALPLACGQHAKKTRQFIAVMLVHDAFGWQPPTQGHRRHASSHQRKACIQPFARPHAAITDAAAKSNSNPRSSHMRVCCSVCFH